MKHTEFTPQRQELHLKMGQAYSKFLNFVFVQNKDDDDLQISLNEARIKFLSTYFVTHAKVSPIFDHRIPLLSRVSADRRYIHLITHN